MKTCVCFIESGVGFHGLVRGGAQAGDAGADRIGSNVKSKPQGSNLFLKAVLTFIPTELRRERI
jgi:hypothetical protein